MNGVEAAAEIAKGLGQPIESVVLTPDALIAQITSGAMRLPSYVEATRVVLSSLDTRWNDILVEQHHLLSSEPADVTYKRHVVVNSNLFNTIKLQKKTPHY
jgi:hypothetical protein